MPPQRRRCIVTAKQIAVKKYVVKLSEEERAQLNTLIHTGKRPAWQALRARILLKADASEVGESWSDSQIAAALDTTPSVPTTVSHLPPGSLPLRVPKDHLAHAHAPHTDRCRARPRHERRP